MSKRSVKTDFLKDTITQLGYRNAITEESLDLEKNLRQISSGRKILLLCLEEEIIDVEEFADLRFENRERYFSPIVAGGCFTNV